MDIGMRSLHPAAADHRVSIRGSRCTALIHAFAEEPSRRPGSSAVVQRLWRRDVTSPFPPSGNEGYIRNRDVPFQSVTPSHVGWPTKLGSLPKRHRSCPSSALCRPPDPSYKADDRTGLYTEKVNYCCSLSNPNSRTWVTLGSVPFRLEEAHCGVTSSQRGLSDITHVK